MSVILFSGLYRDVQQHKFVEPILRFITAKSTKRCFSFYTKKRSVVKMSELLVFLVSDAECRDYSRAAPKSA